MAGRSNLANLFVPSGEAGVSLEIVVARPAGDGPFPAVIFNHGSTGRGQNRAMFRRTVSPAVIAGYLAARGWMTLFPQRRGRGKSGGSYGEALASDGSGYSCDADIALAGFERAVEDIDDVLRELRNLPDICQDRLLIAGVSRGGILAIAYAGMRPGRFLGAVNFNGGWLGRACPEHERLNPLLFARGALAGVPTLWLHGSHDPCCRIGDCRRNFDQFQSLGGQVSFVCARAGHALIFRPTLWKPPLDTFMGAISPP